MQDRVHLVFRGGCQDLQLSGSSTLIKKTTTQRNSTHRVHPTQDVFMILFH